MKLARVGVPAGLQYATGTPSQFEHGPANMVISLGISRVHCPCVQTGMLRREVLHEQLVVDILTHTVLRTGVVGCTPKLLCTYGVRM